MTSSAARRHFSMATSCVVPWISGTNDNVVGKGSPSARVQKLAIRQSAAKASRLTLEIAGLDVDRFTLC